jgi:hypothetical protein
VTNVIIKQIEKTDSKHMWRLSIVLESLFLVINVNMWGPQKDTSRVMWNPSIQELIFFVINVIINAIAKRLSNNTLE